MSASRFRLAVFVLLVLVFMVTLSVGMWAAQWRYITTTAGGLLRFNRFTGAEEIYACEVAGPNDLRAWGGLYIQPGRVCFWMRREESGGAPTSGWAYVEAFVIVVLVAAGIVVAEVRNRRARTGAQKALQKHQ
jgi:hypothetical protein